MSETVKVETSASLGAAFATALAAKDFDAIRAILHPELDFRGRERVGYRLRVRNPEGLFEVEQQVYLGEVDGRIGWMRTLCSGFRPIPAE